MRKFFGSFGLAITVMACTHPAPTTAPPRAAESPSSVVALAAEPAVDSISGPARLMLLTQSPFAFYAFMHSPAPVAQLGQDTVGYIDGTGARALATLREVRRIPGPPDLKEVCVAEDGRTTFAKSHAAYQDDKLWRTEYFDDPLEIVGVRPVAVRNNARGRESTWIVQGDEGTLLADCETGRVQRVTAPAREVSALHWTDAVQLLRVRPVDKGTAYCLLRASGSTGFAELPNCGERSRPDGSISIEKMAPEASKGQPKPKPPAPVCLLVLDRAGKKLPCETPVGPPRQSEASSPQERGSLLRARFYAKDMAVAPSAERGLFRLVHSDALEPENRIGPESLGRCEPLLTTKPVFSCDDPDFDVVVRVDADGTLKQELRRPRPPEEAAGQRRKARFDHTTDGGLAVGGDCEGNLSEAACVRDRSGNWHTVAFGPNLVTALNRTAPVTRLIPTLDGQLFLGTGTLDRGLGARSGGRGGLGGDLRILIFPAAWGEPTSIRNLPVWIVEALAGLVDDPIAREGHLDLGFVGARRIRLWPLGRKHPVFGTSEHCRVDMTLDGSFETDCTQGRLFASGHFGLLQKQLYEVYETLDGGESWAKVSLPKGLETDEIACTPLGCRIGPYWRAGWGEPTPEP